MTFREVSRDASRGRIPYIAIKRRFISDVSPTVIDVASLSFSLSLSHARRSKLGRARPEMARNEAHVGRLDRRHGRPRGILINFVDCA